jgi:ankyrin repeat protein
LLLNKHVHADNQLAACLTRLSQLSESATPNRHTKLHEAVINHGDIGHAITSQAHQLDQLDEAGNTPIHYAILFDDVDALDVLLAAGADPNMASLVGITPLILATRFCRESCVRTLLDSGRCDVNSSAKPWGTTALNYSAAAPRPEEVDQSKSESYTTIMSLLLEAGASTSFPDSAGETVIHSLPMAWIDGPEFKRRFRILCQHGGLASLNTKKYDGLTPVMAAVVNDNAEAIHAFVKAGAVLDGFHGSGRWNILHTAAATATSETIACLRALDFAGVDADAPDRWGDDPLEYLRRRQSTEPHNSTNGPPHHSGFGTRRLTDQEETDMEALIREVKTRNLAVDLLACQGVREALRAADLRETQLSLSPLLEKRKKWDKTNDVATLEFILWRAREGDWDSALEALDEVIDIWESGKDLPGLFPESESVDVCVTVEDGEEEQEKGEAEESSEQRQQSKQAGLTPTT